METIPDELWYHSILPCLTLYELCVLRSVSKQLNERVKKHFSLLTSLDTRDYYNIIDENGFCHVLKFMKNLTYVNVAKCWNILSEASLVLMMCRCHHIEVFIASGCGQVTDEMIEILVKSSPKIIHLNISKCYNITHLALFYIAKYLPNLEELYVANNYGVRDESIRLISESCKKLTKLDLGGCIISGYSLEKFLSGQSRLQELRLTKCRNLSDVIVERLVARGIIVNTCF